MTQIRAGMEIQEDVLKLRIENEQLKNQLDNIKANADYQIEGRDLEIKELKEQNTNLQIMLKAEREVRCNDDYLKRVCELEEELADYQFNYPTIKELSKENINLKKQIADIKANCDFALEGKDVEIKELKALLEKYRQATDKILHITFMGGGCEVNTIGQYATLVDGYLTDVEGLAKWKE